MTGSGNNTNRKFIKVVASERDIWTTLLSFLPLRPRPKSVAKMDGWIKVIEMQDSLKM